MKKLLFKKKFSEEGCKKSWRSRRCSYRWSLNSMRREIVNEERVNVKLPKLIITISDGTSVDWFRFRNQFESEIDKAEIGPMSKFSYLEKFLIPGLRLLIDSLPFTRAKLYYLVSLVNQLKLLLPNLMYYLATCCSKFTSKADIWFLWKVSGKCSNPWHHEQVKEINGYIRLILDELPAIRKDLVRIDEDWQEWTFPQLVDALRKWATRNPKIIPSPEKGFKRENAY